MTYQYLALGDSYTIGEQVAENDNFPNQTIQLLQQKNIKLVLSDLIAVTGWTTDELKQAILHNKPSSNNDWVTLLIGVNNQYRGRTLENYALEFDELLHMAIKFARNKPQRVIVLSIPDWGVTPFAEGRDRNEIANAIDNYNTVNQRIATQCGVHYIDITPSTRKNGINADFLAKDGLHPSAKEYSIWAEKVATIIAASK